jgi:lysozyme
MQLSKDGLALIKEFEGYHERLPDGSCKAYICPAGKLTIGYGCTEGVHHGMVATEAQALEMFAREMKKHEDVVARLVTVPLSQSQFDALVSGSFNAGFLTLKDGSPSTLRTRLNAGDYDGAGQEFLKWTKHADEKTGRLIVSNGLVRRRAAELALYMKDKASGPMPQAAETAPPPTNAGLRATSRKFWLADWLQRLLGIGLPSTIGLMSVDPAAMPGMLVTLSGAVKDHGVVALAIAGALLFSGLAAMKKWTKEDVEAGRATPSGDAT